MNRLFTRTELVCIALLFILAIAAYHVLTAGAGTYSLPIGPTR